MTSQHSGVRRGDGVIASCAVARLHEEAGEYDLARAALSDYWTRVGERPRLEGLSPREASEVLLRVGCLTGWLGSARQVEGAQELALDLLSECAGSFEQMGDGEKAAEAQNGIALVYWRKGAFDEARIHLRNLLKRPDAGLEQELSAIVNLTVVERSDGNIEEALRIHEESAHLFLGDEVSARLKATFNHGYALTHRKAGNTDEALLKYAATTKYLDEAGDTGRLAIVENNLAFLYYTLKCYREALEHAVRARTIYEGRRDKRGVAQVNETISRILIETGDYEGAERTAKAAVITLRGGDEKALLVEALTAHATSLARLGRRRAAITAFAEAEDEALNFVGRKEAGVVTKRMIEEIIAPLCLEAGLSLEEPVNLLEKMIVRSALDVSNKSMKEAALRLGVEYDTLRYIINERHSELRDSRSKIVPRRSSRKNDLGKVKNLSDRPQRN